MRLKEWKNKKVECKELERRIRSRMERIRQKNGKNDREG